MSARVISGAQILEGLAREGANLVEGSPLVPYLLTPFGGSEVGVYVVGIVLAQGKRQLDEGLGDGVHWHLGLGRPAAGNQERQESKTDEERVALVHDRGPSQSSRPREPVRCPGRKV